MYVMLGLLNGPGFLGTNAPFISDLSLVLIAVSAALFTFGRHTARNGRYEIHRWVQTAGVALSTLVALGFMLRSFTTHILPGIPPKLLTGDYAVSTLHALVGAAALLLGVFVVLRGHNLVPHPLRFNNYKPVMRLTYRLYMLASLLGLLVYILVFVLGI
jgi:uncharacterized membrane protein YozB (DUF420 family)